MASPLIRICVALSIFIVTIQAEQMLAVAPVTALAAGEGFDRRRQFGDCPAATQTLCPDKLGCCPSGAACTYSRGIAVCEETCNGGPTCTRGGCCQIGYVCGTTNNFCTPAATALPKQVIEASVTTGSAPVSTPAGAAEDPASDTFTLTASATTTRPNQAAYDLPHETESTKSATMKASAPNVRASSSHRVAGAIATATTATAHDGSKYVGKVSDSGTEGASPSAQATDSGAGFVFVSGTNGFLVGMVLGWFVSYLVLIQ